jgi:hypothetical protein
MGELNLTYVQYSDLTLYEITAMIAGYNVRWEENWKPFRSLYTLLYNVNTDKKDRKTAEKLMPLPSDFQLQENPADEAPKGFSALAEYINANSR